MRHLLGQVSKETSGIYKSYLSSAFKRAVEVDGLLERNPMAGVNLGREAAAVNPDKGADLYPATVDMQPGADYRIEDKLRFPKKGVKDVIVYNSGIVNDPNLWCEERGDEKYILNLLLRVITVSVETVKIVKALPLLGIID